MRAGPADGARGLQAFLAAGLVWRGDDAGHEIVRQALPPPPGVLPRLIDTWKRIAYLRPGLTADGRHPTRYRTLPAASFTALARARRMRGNAC